MLDVIVLMLGIFIIVCLVLVTIGVIGIAAFLIKMMWMELR